MKRVVAYLAGAVLLAVSGGVCLAISRINRDIADTERRVVAQDLKNTEAHLDTAERYLGYASLLPWVGSGPVNDVRARKASLLYWQRQYAAIIPRQTDPVAAIPADNVELQLVVANAVYRNGQTQAKDKQTTLDALNLGIGAYATVLRNSSRHDDAAFNFEYLVRLRDDVEKGRKRPAAQAEDPLGAGGHFESEHDDTSNFKTYVPLEKQERKQDGEAGKAAPKPRKG